MGRLGILFLIAVSCFGQVSSNVVYQSGNLIVSTPVLLIPANNIGQSSHILQVAFTNAVGKTCTAQGLQSVTNIRLEGTFSSSGPWVPIGASVTAPALDGNSNITGTTVVFGSYPFIRVDPIGWDITNCLAAYSYSGSLYPTSISTVMMGVNTNYLSLHSELTSGAGTYVLKAALAGTRIVIYGISIINEAASVTPTLIRDEHLGACGGVILGNVFAVTTPGMAANSSIIWPSSGTPYYISPESGSSICLTTTNANNVVVDMVYRLE